MFYELFDSLPVTPFRCDCNSLFVSGVLIMAPEALTSTNVCIVTSIDVSRDFATINFSLDTPHPRIPVAGT